jgi:hypothetical protein
MELLERPSRRSFLIGAATGSAAVAAVAAGRAGHSVVPAPPAQPVRRGMSEHALKYYRTTRI